MESAAAYAVLDLFSILDLDISDALFGVFYGGALLGMPFESALSGNRSDFRKRALFP